MIIHASTSIEELADKLLSDVLEKKNFEDAASGKSSFLTGGSVIVCESKGLQEYIQKRCADNYGIWTALSFKPLAGLLMRCAFDLSSVKKDEKDNVFNQSNLIWAIYRLLEGEKKKYFFANELASLFQAYQIYRPEMIQKWNKGQKFTIPGTDDNFINNEKFQRELWLDLKSEFKNEKDISELYELFSAGSGDVSYKHIFVFAPVSIASLQLKALKLLSEKKCKVNMYLHQISNEYTGDAKGQKFTAKQRKKAWENNKVFNEEKLYWDLGNSLVANLGRSAQVLCEQIGWDNLEHGTEANNIENKTSLEIIKNNILNDCNPEMPIKKDDSIIFNNCFSILRELEVLCDFILELFSNDKNIKPSDIAIVSPNIDDYANAAESVFSRYDLPFAIADRDIKKHDKTARLLNMIFSLIDSRFEAPDICSLFEFAMYVQGREPDNEEIDLLHKWVNENAIRHGLEREEPAPNYSFKTGFEQLASGFFMISKTEFSEKGDYCYPDIEGKAAFIFGELAGFIEALNKFKIECKEENTIEEWDDFFKNNLKPFFGNDEVNFNEDDENPYQQVMAAWDSLKNEMNIGFSFKKDIKIDFSVIKKALPNKIEQGIKYQYKENGRISFSNIETLRLVPKKVICCIGMNGKEYPRQVRYKEISLMNNYMSGDKDSVNEDRLIFLETIRSAEEKLYISWVGQNDKTSEILEPSSAVAMLLNYLNENKDGNIHPLHPFSEKYYNGELNYTYDVRWNNKNTDKNKVFDVWKWQINTDINNDEILNNKELIRIFNDVSKYFIKNKCNIVLQDKADHLDGIEPFVLESKLTEWKLTSTILDYFENEEYLRKIKVQQRRGELPDGIFAQNLINEKIKTAKLLKEEAGKNEGKHWIVPSKDKGKYRLRHWLYHLNYNAFEEAGQNTKMFLFDKEPVILELKGMKKEDAQELLNNLVNTAKELETHLIPVFPNAAWIYVKENKIADKNTFIDYSNYAELALKNIDEISGEFKDKFIEYSEKLFENYFTYEVKREKS